VTCKGRGHSSHTDTSYVQEWSLTSKIKSEEKIKRKNKRKLDMIDRKERYAMKWADK